MADNALTGTNVPVATDKVTHSGDADQNLQLFRPVHVTGAEGSKTVVEITSGDGQYVHGSVAHDAVDSGSPIKIGGKASTSTPTPVATGDRVNTWFDEYGRMVISQYDPESANHPGRTSLRDQLTAERCTVLGDSLADGLATFWTTTNANGGTSTTVNGEGVIATSASATGSSQITSSTINYFPGQQAWFNSAGRFSDTGSAGNVRRIGPFTVSGIVPQDGAYFELTETAFNAVVVKGGVATAVASSAWSRFSTAPFTFDTNYHSFEVRYTANSFWFYVDNILRHSVSGTGTALTNTLNFPITIQSINTSGASDRFITVRNCGLGRFGSPMQVVEETGLFSLRAVAIGGATAHDAVDSGYPLKIGGRAQSVAPTDVSDGDRVNAWFLRNGAQATVLTAGGALIGGNTNGVFQQGSIAHDGVDAGNPVKIGGRAVSHGANPTAVAAADRSDLLTNRAGVPFMIGGHPNVQTIRLQFTAAQTNAAIITVAAGLKIVVTAFQVTLDNASTVFPSVRIGFGAATTPTTSGVIGAHGGVPAGGGFSRGDGSGIIGVGADDEDLRITTVGVATGNGVEVIVTYYTIES